MKKSTSIALIVLVQALLLAAGAFAALTVSSPHYDETSGFVCTTCHTTHLTLGSTGYNNTCQSCHRPGDPAAGAKPITPADAANPFGIHSTSGISKMYQTSHRWDGSDTNPAAGAQPPLQAQMTTSNLRARTQGQLACVRCHNQHSNTNGHFLRMANDSDQMCLDCHRSRNTTDATKGTHPVGVSYDGTKAGFKPIPSISGNTTADLNNYLKNGTVSCTTCHGVHFTDSRSSTVDGSDNFANLSSSDGYLLRTDKRGKNPGAGFDSTLNICTNCHANKSSHNLKGQDIQCADCHGAHIEFDKNDPSGSKGINIKLLRRNVNPGSNGSGRIFYRYTASRREYKNADNTGVCQGCHAVPPSGGIYPSEHDSSDARTCNSCHFHSSANGSFSGACTACHGYPPTTATLGGSTGLAVPATGATSTLPGGHDRHAKQRYMGCNTCHTGYAAKSMPSNSIDIGFSINGTNFPGFGGNVSGGIFNGTTLNSGYTWSGGPGTTVTSGNPVITCNVYCHGSTLTGGNATPPTWTITDGSQRSCGTCHGVSSATAPVTASHTRHAKDNTIPCATCHGAHDNNDHVNGSVEWNLSGLGGGATYKGAVSGGTGTVAPSASFGSCANISCHSSGQAADGSTSPLTYGTPVWGGSLSCGDCHKNMKSDAAAPGSHVQHAQTASIACATCHDGYTEASVNTATHSNGSINLAFSGAAAATTYSQGATHPLGNGYGTCSTASCHANVYGTGTVTTPVWGTASGCTACHTTPIASTGPATGSHAKHNVTDCSLCHTGATTNAATPTANHIDGNIDVTNGYPANVAKHAAGSYTGTCSTASCHANVYGSGTVTTPVWGTASGCTACHTTPIASTGPATGSHAKHSVTDCSLCHAGATTSTALPTANHIDGNIDVTNGYPANVAKHAIGTYTGTCSTASCHANVYGTGTMTTPAWGTTAGCSACHTTPIGATGPATGSHVVHNISTCTACHNAGTTATTVPGTGHANGFIDVTNGYPANVTKHAAGTYTGTCSTAICHGQGAPTWGATSAAPVNGFPYSSAQCGKCHAQQGSVTAGTPFYSTAIPKVTSNLDAKVGAHTAHISASESLHPGLGCIDCHGTVALNDPTHMKGSTTFNWSALAKTGNLSPSYDPTTGKCSNVYCHGGAMPGGDTSGSNRTPTWNNPNYLPATLTVAGCSTCHGFPPSASVGHPAVTIPAGFPTTAAIGGTCNCHDNINPLGNSYATIFVDNTKHINGTLEGGACNACHGYPPVSATFTGAGVQNNWSSARTENYAGGGGAHSVNAHVSKLAKHNDGFAFCVNCHSPADHLTSPEVFKPSTNIKVSVDQRYRFEAAKQFKYTSNRLDDASHVTGNCSNSSCHFGASPKWDPAH
ncbi:MAG: CxxxxCH/CxxCH domain-containing protein [Desulfuromonadaceae bacterium]|nr:CxxxxCH/CxxCH domain-containing protein [Desulfuromonadaceae bacterium]